MRKIKLLVLFVPQSLSLENISVVTAESSRFLCLNILFKFLFRKCTGNWNRLLFSEEVVFNKDNEYRENDEFYEHNEAGKTILFPG